MKGQITIEATEPGLHLTGTILIKHEAERFEIIRALSRSLGIDSPEKWAAWKQSAVTGRQRYRWMPTLTTNSEKEKNNNETDAL